MMTLYRDDFASEKIWDYVLDILKLDTLPEEITGVTIDVSDYDLVGYEKEDE